MGESSVSLELTFSDLVLCEHEPTPRTTNQAVNFCIHSFCLEGLRPTKCPYCCGCEPAAQSSLPHAAFDWWLVPPNLASTYYKPQAPQQTHTYTPMHRSALQTLPKYGEKKQILGTILCVKKHQRAPKKDTFELCLWFLFVWVWGLSLASWFGRIDTSKVTNHNNQNHDESCDLTVMVWIMKIVCLLDDSSSKRPLHACMSSVCIN